MKDFDAGRAGWRATCAAIAVMGGLGAVRHAAAATIDLIAPLSDFQLMEPPDPPPPGGAKPYAFTAPSPAWSISQWNIAGAKLAPFAKRQQGTDTVFTSHADEADVEIVRGARSSTVSLSQDGAVLPCTQPSGTPRESDLFISPHGGTALSAAAADIPLSRYQSLTLHLTVTAAGGPSRAPKGCDTDRGSSMVAVVLHNTATRQTLFYQLTLSIVCLKKGAVPANDCAPRARRQTYYSVHNPFGLDDYLSLISGSFLADGERRVITADLLPRLAMAIAAGPEAMDHDLSHWVFNGTYAGQHIYGDARASSKWEDYRLVAETK